MPTAVREHEKNALFHEGNFHSRFPASTQYNLTVTVFLHPRCDKDADRGWDQGISLLCNRTETVRLAAGWGTWHLNRDQTSRSTRGSLLPLRGLKGFKLSYIDQTREHPTKALTSDSLLSILIQTACLKFDKIYMYTQFTVNTLHTSQPRPKLTLLSAGT